MQVTSERKFQIDQHIKTPSHASKLSKMKLAKKGQQTLPQCLPSTSKKSEQEQFNEDLCLMFVSADIPLHKINNLNVKLFLQKYTSKYNIPDESTLRKNYIHRIYAETMSSIKKAVSNNYLYICADETTDSMGRYIVHLMIGILNVSVPAKSYLISSKQLEKANNLTVTRFIQEELATFFLPESIPTEKILLFLTDAAPYMVKAACNLKIFYPNLIHTTCLAHGLNRVAEEVRNHFPLVNSLISSVKKVFLKAPLRVQLYKQHLPGIPLPPQPVITRWGTWLEAAIFHANHYEIIKTIIMDLDSDTQSVLDAQKVYSSKEIPQQLAFINANYSFISTSILQLEKQCMSLIESVEIINKFEKLCFDVKGKVGKSVYEKFLSVIEKNEGFKKLKDIAKILCGESVENIELTIEDISNLKYAPITSVDVERSFSIYKYMLSDRRHNFSVENFEKYVIVNCFHS